MLKEVSVSTALCLCACEPTQQGYAPTQPIAYSHAVHAGANQIPCLYCHDAALYSRHAGIPSASTCMNCHKHVATEHPEVQKVKAALAANTPIVWTQVHFLPDHVYFNHSIHVRGGLRCQECHGPVESMGVMEQWAPLTMGWCLDCHRHQESEETRVQLQDCAVCHH